MSRDALAGASGCVVIGYGTLIVGWPAGNLTSSTRETPMFTADDIQARLREKPFVPIRLITSSGQSYDVTHPELVLVGRRSLIIGTANNENPSQFEAVSRVALLHVTDVQDAPNPSPATGNGQSP
jgi:hypothetical protein